MKKRIAVTLFAVATVLLAIGFVKYRQIQAAIALGASFQPPPEAVTTTVAATETWHDSLEAIGSVTAVKGVVVSADLPGIVESIAFDSGDPVTSGDVLVRQDTRQERAQLAAAEAQRVLAGLNYERIRGLREKGVTSQAELDTAEAERDSAEAKVGEIRAAIERKTIRAPFTGILGIRAVNLGQYLTSGQPVVPLQALDPIYVNFSVPQQDLEAVKPGSGVRVTAEGQADVDMTGRVTAIDSVVNESTRNVQVQATLANPNRVLRPGMFVRMEIALEAASRVVPIPASSVNYAPYGNSVFIVEEMKTPNGGTYRGVRQQFVKLGASRGDQIALLSGVEPGAEIVTSGTFKLRNGAAVQVDNEIQPGNDPAPQPEDN